ncbi:MAG: glutamine--fructose-6-phosphate transaminase (isomerizing) [Alphaproteobacteria bacterium]|nr:glutamine--fructose-6-phosphate transaminase (isomerizing) [Alphaproteobacteria bacterium]MDA7983839.1 glutamine--fructose-6-phosphate transaminase (isomerizing) [Alphaproteobacteria bacterium]MDA7988540.1 glutamine--fructose-6-phosphate transaminase (isomerizing) [Alphaproteobacteria bacterium]
MCGIIAISSDKQVAAALLAALKQLEYRGYDSAGLATLEKNKIHTARAQGKLAALEEKLKTRAPPGSTGIGHTRWATHGRPSEQNAHPVIAEVGGKSENAVAVVHNGIIENHAKLKQELARQNLKFHTDTDTEVIAQLTSLNLAAGLPPLEAVTETLKRLEGAFALAFLFSRDDTVIGARRGSPLAVGQSDNTLALGSDVLALAPIARQIAYLEEGDIVVLSGDTPRLFNAAGENIQPQWKAISPSSLQIGKGQYQHFMQKEIYEQPAVVGETLDSFLDPARLRASFPEFPFDTGSLRKVLLSACGTAYYATVAAQYWIEGVAGLPCSAEIASELRYRDPALGGTDLAVFVSQSGETMDTLEAARMVARAGVSRLAVVNQGESTLARECEMSLLTRAGAEIGVASTKAFTTQLALLGCFALELARAGGVSDERLRAYGSALMELPSRLYEALTLDERVSAIAADISRARHALYLGRGAMYPLALEGALKLKEISYIHAEGYPGGEMKHGPLALVDDEMPVIVLAPSGPLFGKIASNAEEVMARGGRVLLISDAEGLASFGGEPEWTLEMPSCDVFVQPILYALPVQLLAYYAACHRGTDVDQPRNLAKSVTVE